MVLRGISQKEKKDVTNDEGDKGAETIQECRMGEPTANGWYPIC